MRLKDVEGLAFPEVWFLLGERVSSVQYARALGIEDSLLCRSDAARAEGLGGRPVPPALFAFFLTVSPDDLVKRLGFTWGRTLAVAIDVEWPGVQVTEEDEVAGCSVVESAWERAGRNGGTRQFLRLRTDFRTGEAVVCRWRVLFLESLARDPNQALPDAEPDDVGVAPLVAPGTDASQTPPEDGSLPSHCTPTLDRMALARLSVAMDNPDPLHLDDDVARAAGFERAVGQGSAVVGLLHEPVRRWAGLATPVRMATTQRAPFGLGDALRADGRYERTDEGTPTCMTTVSTDGGTEIGQARVAIGGPARP